MNILKCAERFGCEPYICTNAGTGTAEEMSDWVEYCNLETEGKYAKWRIANGHENLITSNIGVSETKTMEIGKLVLKVPMNGGVWSKKQQK